MKSKELKSYNLPENRVLLSYIDAKPTVELCGLAFIGILLILTFSIYIVGFALMSFSVAILTFLPRRVLIEFYGDYLVLYNHANKNDCEMIYYCDVSRWSYISNFSDDYLSIVLKDDSIHQIDGFSRMTYENHMNRFLKDKREKIKRNRKNESE